MNQCRKPRCQRRRQPDRPAIRRYNGNGHVSPGKNLAIPQGLLAQHNPRTARLDQGGHNFENIVDPCRTQVADIQLPDGKSNGRTMRPVGKLGVVDPAMTQEVRTAAFEEADIGAVIDKAGEIRVLVINANGKHMAPRNETT